MNKKVFSFIFLFCFGNSLAQPLTKKEEDYNTIKISENTQIANDFLQEKIDHEDMPLIVSGNVFGKKDKVQSLISNVFIKSSNVHFYDLSKQYPDFKINVGNEKKIIKEHNKIVIIFPLSWNSPPAIIQQWLELILDEDALPEENIKIFKDKKIKLIVLTQGRNYKLSDGLGSIHIDPENQIQSILQLFSMLNNEVSDLFVIHLNDYSLFSSLEDSEIGQKMLSDIEYFVRN